MSHPSEQVQAPAAQIAARVRAALAYASLRYEDMPERSKGQMTAAKLRRIASATSPRGADLVELWCIADACEVPRAWLEDGHWDDSQGKVQTSIPRFGEGSLPDRVAVLERYVTALVALHEAAQGGEPPLPFDETLPVRPAGRTNERSR